MKRRQFIGEVNCAALGSASILSTLLNLKLANNVAAATLDGTGDCKTLVCLYLGGGMDSYNFMVPTDNTRFNVYRQTRTNLALPRTLGETGNGQAPLIPLNQLAGGDGQPYGLHPACTGLADMFNGTGAFTGKRRMALVTNVGTLIEPTTKAEYDSRSHPLPKALFSHSDQTEQWQTALPQGGTRLTGWAGRIGDVLHSTYNNEQASMNISFDGNNIFQLGDRTQPFVVRRDGAISFDDTSSTNPAHPLNLKNVALKNMIERDYANLVDQAFVNVTDAAVETQVAFQEAFTSFSETLDNPFPDTSLASEFFAVLKTIHIRQALGLRRQTIFIDYGGWDHHGELLNNQNGKLEELNGALLAFQLGLEQLGHADSTITFTASDFARTLRSNGQGTDHAWGGNCMVIGGAVDGGKVYGTFPNLSLDESNPDGAGRGGRIIPTTSCDKYFEPMLNWFGAGGSINTILPNLSNFSGSPDVNYIA